MAFLYYKYDTNYGNTIVDRSDTSFAPVPPYEEIYIDFTIPEIQPLYLYANSGGTGGTIIVNSQEMVDIYLGSTELPPTSDGNVTYGEFTGTTAVLSAETAQLKLSSITGATNLGIGNGVLYSNIDENKINLKSLSGGTNITITCNGNYVTINSTGGGGTTWGSITGNITGQTDLNNCLNSKQVTITGGASTITTSNLLTSRALISDSSGKVTTANTTSTEIAYLFGVTGSVQTQLNDRVLSSTYNTYVNTTAPATYLSKSAFNTYSGTTVPANYYNKTQINSYTGATSTAIGLKAPITSPTFLVSAAAPNPAQNDKSTCIATTCWYSCQCATATPLMNGVGAVGTSLLWTKQDHVHPSDTSRVPVTTFNTYTGTTAPAAFASKSAFNTYTGTTAPATYLGKTAFNTYSGTTIPNTYYNKTQINSYTGATATAIGLKANIASPTFTGTVRSVTPTANDNSTCIATTAWYIGQGGTATPLMDGIGACGTSNLFARQDHVHPVDTSRVAKAGDTMTGALVINSTLTVTGTTILRGTTCLGAPATSTITDNALFYNPTTCAITQYHLTGGSKNYHYTDRLTNATTTSATCVKFLGYTASTFQAGRYQLDMGAQFGNSTSNACTLVALKFDGATIGSNFLNRAQAANWNAYAATTRDTTLTAGTHCFEIWFWAGTGTACISSSVIRVKLID